MAAEDLDIKEHLESYGFPVLILLIVLMFLKMNLKSFQNKIFAGFSARMVEEYNKLTDSYKEELFKTLHDMESGDWKRKNEGQLLILEIGVGSGANLKYYPKNTRLIAVEPNPYFPQHFCKNHSKYSHITLDRFCQGYGEDMSMIADNSVDAVVTTLVLCSVRDTRKVLQEIKRILVPNGKLFYMEHVHDRRRTWLHFLQSILSVTRIWPAFNDGCMLNRNTDDLVKKAGFSQVDQRRFTLDVKLTSTYGLVKTHAFGTATTCKDHML